MEYLCILLPLILIILSVLVLSKQLKSDFTLKNLFNIFWNSGWIYPAGFAVGCIFIIFRHYPCSASYIVLPIAISFIFPLFLFLASFKNKYAIIGADFGAINGALSLTWLMMGGIRETSTTLGMERIWRLEIVGELFTTLSFGIVVGSIIGATCGLVLWLVQEKIGQVRQRQQVWRIITSFLVIANLVLFVVMGWGTFGERWLAQEKLRGFTTNHEDELLKAINEYNGISDKITPNKFTPNSIQVLSYTGNTATVAVQEGAVLGDYQLSLINDTWRVSGSEGGCPINLEECIMEYFPNYHCW
jgi:hypothetical protein